MTDNNNGSGRTEAIAPEEIAERAGLRYVNDEEPGFRRRRCGRGFTFVDPKGRTVRDEGERQRFLDLVIPPAWTEVWICADSEGHLQCTGRDDRGRKQYLYHPRWEEERERAKFERLAGFGEALPSLRRRVRRDLRLPEMSRDKVVAVVVKLLETCCVRIGNQEYARDNESFGLTTLRRHHLKRNGKGIQLHFVGKSHQEVEVAIEDRRLAALIEECDAVPGWELFRYRNGSGQARTVASDDVNEYIRDATGGPYTAKDFRTWMASERALQALLRGADSEDLEEREQQILAALDEAAELLHNTREVCRSAYVHPGALEAHREGRLADLAEPAPARPRGLRKSERALLAVLRGLS